MNLLEKELNTIKSLLFKNIDNFQKDVFPLIYGRSINLDLKLNNWTRGSYLGDKAFIKSMNIAIKEYKISKYCVKLNFTISQHIIFYADMSKNLNELINAVEILLKNIGSPTEKQIIFAHTKDKKSVDVDIIGYINYCECVEHYAWKHLFK